MFQAMAAWDQDYSYFEDQNDSDFSYNETECESISSSDLSQIEDYEIEERPLRERALMNVQAQAAPSDEVPLETVPEQQFEDASSPEKAPASASAFSQRKGGAFALRDLAKRKYTEDDPDSPPSPRSRPKKRISTRLQLHSDSSEEEEYVPARSVLGASQGPSGSRSRGRPPARQRQRSRSRGRLGRSRPVIPAPQDPATPVDGAQAPIPPPIPRAQQPLLLEKGGPPYPGHTWPANQPSHPFEKMSYKRARGDLQTKAGDAIRVMRQEVVGSKDGVSWHNAPTSDVPDLVLPLARPPNGHPIESELSNVVRLEDYIYALLDTGIITSIVDRTNEYMEQIRPNCGMSEESQQQPAFQAISVLEFKALIGLLIMTGVRHDGHLSMKMMFEKEFGALFYRSIFSHKRFEWLMRTIRFDNRRERDPTDKFAPIRAIWDLFIANCKRLYSPGACVTVDEMLAAFRGRVPFKMYIPSKPAKYGIKLFMVNDAASQYALNAIPYLGNYFLLLFILCKPP